jgi:hypothetical protein
MWFFSSSKHLTCMTSMLLSLQTRPITKSFFFFYIFRIKKSLKRYQMVNQKQSLNQRRTDSTMVKRKRTCGTRLSLLLLQTWWYVINEKRTGSLFRKVYSCHNNSVDRYGVYVSQMTTDMFLLS